MPNHCETDLFVHGNKKLVAEVIAKHFLPTGELNCDSVISYPLQFRELDAAAANWEVVNKDNPDKDWNTRPKDGFNSGGYEWRVSNWGTKWGTYDGRKFRLTTRGFSTRFDSAWSPPTPVVQKLAEMYPGLMIKMRSYEQGCAFQCQYVWKQGCLISHYEIDYRGGRGG
jgi:hypothetical protein